MSAGNVTATVTAKTGPGITVTGQVLTNVSEIRFRFKDGVVDIYRLEPPTMSSFEYSDISTVTITPSAKTVVLST
jgi:hypothetical protein